MADDRKMRCPRCGAAMNHHANKLVSPTEPDADGNIDPVFGGMIQETHTCPACAYVEFRQPPAAS